MSRNEQASDDANTTGLLHNARGYDLLVWLLTFGRERAFRERVLELGGIAPGERVLDVGCGTGTLAIAAKRRVGPAGSVDAIDASPEMIARARRKAGTARVDVRFERANAEQLPFPDGSFDAVLSTIMLHHLPPPARARCLREIRRVLAPNGRVLVVDFESSGPRRSIWGRFHRRHGHVKSEALVALLPACGLRIEERGVVGIRDLHFVRAVPG